MLAEEYDQKAGYMWYDVENDNFWGSQATSSSIFKYCVGKLLSRKILFGPQNFIPLKQIRIYVA